MRRETGDGRRERARAETGVADSPVSRPPSPVSDWWRTYFDDGYLREFEPFFDLAEDRRQAGRVLDLLALPVGARVLDCACGQGRHAHLLAEAGLDVDAVDLSASLLATARARGTGRTLRYRRADMRRLPAAWTGRFDAVLNLFTSFGFFADPRDDERVVGEFARVLAPGGVLLWHGGDRDGVMAKFVPRDWWTTADGTLVAQERSFDPLSGVLTVDSVWRGPHVHEDRSHRIRLYTPTQMADLLHGAGLIVEQVFDSFSDRPLSRRSSEMLLLARKTG